jgi:hypothetical protein
MKNKQPQHCCHVAEFYADQMRMWMFNPQYSMWHRGSLLLCKYARYAVIDAQKAATEFNRAGGMVL